MTKLWSLSTQWSRAGVTALLILAASAMSGSAAPKRDPNALQPSSAKYQGALTPVTSDLADVISGNTVVIVQPWVGRKTYELRENPVYFKANGTADSLQGLDITWRVRQNEICLISKGEYCYLAYTDEAGQAYIEDGPTGLIGRVASIERGDSRGVRAQAEARQAQEEAKLAMQKMFIGWLGEALMSGGGTGGGSSMSEDDRLGQRIRDRIDNSVRGLPPDF